MLVLTVVNSTGQDDPQLTRIGAIGFTIKETGGLKMEKNRTVATRFFDYFPIKGTWVRVRTAGGSGALRRQSILTALLLPALACAAGGYRAQGKVEPPPEIESAVAKSGKQPQGGYGPGTLDTLTVTMTKIVYQPPIGNQSAIDDLLEFVPPLIDVNYTG